MADSVEFIDCTTLSINYSVMGLATVTYTVVSNKNGPVIYNSINAGGRTMVGHVVNVTFGSIPMTSGWFETQVSLSAWVT